MGLLLKHCKVPKYYGQDCVKIFFLVSTLRMMIEISEKKNALLLVVFGLPLPQHKFSKGVWELGHAFTQIIDFSNIFLFPKILSLNLFGNS